MKKIVKYILLPFIIFFISISGVYGGLTEDNLIIDAFSQRKDRILELVGGGKLEMEINLLKGRLESLNVGNRLNQDVKNKLLDDLVKIEENLNELNLEIFEEVSEGEEFDLLLDKYVNELNIKRELVNELNKSTQNNEINQEKISVLLDKYIVERNKIEENKNKEKLIKVYIFLFFTILAIFIYFFTTHLVKKGRLNNKKSVYINFFILFSYIIFLIWFFFYLYPELSIFLIFISGYLLVINSHLIGSFIGSIIVLERFKIGDIIKFNEIEGQIIKINPLYAVILPLTHEGIFINKPVYIPHINILRESVIKDDSAGTFIHKFEITIKDDWCLDIMKFVEGIEQNILTKFLNNRLSSINGLSDFYRTSFERTHLGHIVVVFIWKGDDILNKKVERKIIGYLGRVVYDAKKQIELKQNIINDDSENIKDIA